MGIAFIARLGDFGTLPALIEADGRVVTYADLAARIAARRQELGPARRLIFWEASAGGAAIVTYLAALAGGHPILPMPSACSGEAHAARQQLIDRYRPDLIVTRDGDRPGIDRSGADPATADLHPDLALLLSTSGSTGSPKLVRLSAAGIDSNARAIGQYLALTPRDRSALILPLHYSYGLSVLHAHLAAGASLCLGLGPILRPGFLDLLARRECTNLSGVPHSFEMLEQIGLRRRDLPHLRFLTVAGGRLAPDKVSTYARHMAASGGAFFVMYGQTEATARMAYLPPESAASHPDCIGIAIPGGKLRLVDERGAEIAATGMVGELVYRGDNVMLGYAECRADLTCGRDVVELATGDLAERNAEGFYRIAGRRQRFSKIAGLRIGHDALEQALAARGLFAAVTGDDRLLLVALTEAGQAARARRCVCELTGLPAALIRTEAFAALPRRSNGKIDYPALRAHLGQPAPPPVDAGAVRAAFAEIFTPRQVRGGDSFAGLGGDSLSYVELTLALKAHLDPLPAGWEQRSVDELTDLSRAAGRPIRKRWHSGVKLESDLFLRGCAILLIVLHHATLWPLAGGAATLLMLVGYNLARHHGERLMRGEVGTVLRSCLRPVLLYYVLLLAYCALNGVFPWQNLLLAGNLGLAGYDNARTPLVTYWFVEAYAQILLLTVLLFASATLRDRVRRNPFAAGLIALAASLALRPLADHLIDLGEMRYFFTPRILHVAVLGWCIYFADTARRKAVMAMMIPLLLVGLPWAEGAQAAIVWVRASLLIFASLLLLSGRDLRLPYVFAAGLSALAVASFSIYLLHTWPYFLWLEDAGFVPALRIPLYVGFGLASGLAAHAFLRRVAASWITACKRFVSAPLFFQRPASRTKDAA